MKRILSTLVCAIVIVSCGSDQTQLDDAPTGVVDDSPANILLNADSFPNVAVLCYKGNGIYTTTRDGGDAITIISNDPACPSYNPDIATVVGG